MKPIMTVFRGGGTMFYLAPEETEPGDFVVVRTQLGWPVVAKIIQTENISEKDRKKAKKEIIQILRK